MSGDANKGKETINVQRPSKHNKMSGCAQCFKNHESINQVLVWETMKFCNEICLSEYQNTMSNCSTCKKIVQDSLLGKYCVRFGADIKQFCSNVCLEDHKKGLKVCCYCQKDISGGDGFLAPIGDKGQFKDFCVQECLKKFEAMHCGKELEKSVAKCAVCSLEKEVSVKLVLYPKNEEQKMIELCSQVCLSAYKFSANVETLECDQCHSMSQKLDDEKYVIHYGGKTKTFCSSACQNVYVMRNRDIVPCTWCKVRKYNFDMIEKQHDSSFIHFCSLNCYNSHLKDPKVTTGPVWTQQTPPMSQTMPVIQSVSSLAPTQPPAVQIKTQVVTKTVTETVVKVPEGKETKNKAVMTKPHMVTKGVSCRPHPCHKSTQTDGPSIPCIVPVVVPMYMPMPMAMYAKPYPVPVPVPLPIPVPVFLPTSRNTYRGVTKLIKKIRSKVPADPFEAEMLAMAGALVSKKADEEDEDSEDSVANDDFIDEDNTAKPGVEAVASVLDNNEDLESDIKADRVVPKPLPPVTADPIPMPSPYGQNRPNQRQPQQQPHHRGKRRFSGRDGKKGIYLY